MPARNRSDRFRPLTPRLEGAPPAFSHRFLSFHIVHFTGNIAAERREERSMLTIRQACPEDAPQLSAMGYAAIITTLLISGAMPMNWRYFLSKNMPKMRYVGVLRMRPNTGSSPKPPLLLVSLNIAISSEWLTTARLVRCCISST